MLVEKEGEGSQNEALKIYSSEMGCGYTLWTIHILRDEPVRELQIILMYNMMIRGPGEASRLKFKIINKLQFEEKS